MLLNLNYVMMRSGSERDTDWDMIWIFRDVTKNNPNREPGIWHENEFVDVTCESSTKLQWIYRK